MATFVVGDVQGCWKSLQRMIAECQFSASSDTLLLAGDLVNRGPGSLDVLRYVMDLGESAKAVIGNHDLHLLGRSEGLARPDAIDTLEQVLSAPDVGDMLSWLRHNPLMLEDPEQRWLVVHAGLLPHWDVSECRRRARESEMALRGDNFANLLKRPEIDACVADGPDLDPISRVRVALNAFTRLRVCSPAGRMLLSYSAEPENTPDGYCPWFEAPGRRTQGRRVIFGHWAALGYRSGSDYLALDSGCVWGGHLTCVRLDDDQVFQVACG